MILNEHSFSAVCYLRHLKSKCRESEKVGLIRGIPAIVEKTWFDRAWERLRGAEKTWEGTLMPKYTCFKCEVTIHGRALQHTKACPTCDEPIDPAQIDYEGNRQEG